jgi:hypothetical protein
MCKCDPISDEDEERLCPWTDGSFGMSSSTTMQYNVFFSTTANCLVFRVPDEHRNLDCSV